MAEGKGEITLKRVSAFKFEIEVSASSKRMTSPENLEVIDANPCKSDVQNRISVIRRAPPSSSSRAIRVQSGVHHYRTGSHICGRGENCQGAPSTAILINDAILYRIIEILLWRVLGEKYLACWGYPNAPTYRILWKVVYYYSRFQPEAVSPLHQDHDCQGDINCFLDHVGNFLELCAPTQEIKKKFGWWTLSTEEILRKIYNEDLLPSLRKSDLSNYKNILRSHQDILRLQKWQQQGFTAISWNGHEHFSRLKSRFPWCSQCCRRLRKSVIPY